VDDWILSPSSFVARALAVHGIEELPVTAEIGCRAAALPDVHNDPFDRVIVATCPIGDHTLLTKDRIIPTYPSITVVW
jgi:PIN domain nuclease of toxin-antitoxin system